MTEETIQVKNWNSREVPPQVSDSKNKGSTWRRKEEEKKWGRMRMKWRMYSNCFQKQKEENWRCSKETKAMKMGPPNWSSIGITKRLWKQCQSMVNIQYEERIWENWRWAESSQSMQKNYTFPKCPKGTARLPLPVAPTEDLGEQKNKHSYWWL